MAAVQESLLLSSDRQSEAHRLGDNPGLLVKWRRVRSGRRLRTLLRPSAERREAIASIRARALGVPCPAPLAVGERRHRGVLVGSVLVRPFLDGYDAAGTGVDAAGAAADGNAADGSATDDGLVASLARALRAWHDAGFRHGACYPKNLLVARDGGPAVPVGCSAANFAAPGFRLDRGRRKDLAQFASGFHRLQPDADPLAFLREYAPDHELVPWVKPRFDALTASRHARSLAQPAVIRPVPLPLDAHAVTRTVTDLPVADPSRPRS